MSSYMRATIEFPEEALNIEEVEVAFNVAKAGDTSSYASRGVVTLEDSDAKWGHFEGLETALRIHGFPYTTFSDAHDMEPATVREYRPGEGKAEAFYATEGYLGARMIRIDELLTLKDNPEELVAYVEGIREFKPIPELITEYTGEIVSDYVVQVTPDTQMLIEVKPFTHVYYQLNYQGMLGKVHQVKLLPLVVDNHTDYTFFTKEGVQYWLSQLAIIKANK